MIVDEWTAGPRLGQTEADQQPVAVASTAAVRAPHLGSLSAGHGQTLQTTTTTPPVSNPQTYFHRPPCYTTLSLAQASISLLLLVAAATPTSLSASSHFSPRFRQCDSLSTAYNKTTALHSLPSPWRYQSELSKRRSV